MPFGNNLGMYLNLLYTSVADKFAWTGQLRECPKWPINLTFKWTTALGRVDWTKQSNSLRTGRKIARGIFFFFNWMQLSFYFLFQSCSNIFWIKCGGRCFVHFCECTDFDHIPRRRSQTSDIIYFIWLKISKEQSLLKWSHWWWGQFW